MTPNNSVRWLLAYSMCESKTRRHRSKLTLSLHRATTYIIDRAGADLHSRDAQALIQVNTILCNKGGEDQRSRPSLSFLASYANGLTCQVISIWITNLFSS